jgi:hypothetical protein
LYFENTGDQTLDLDWSGPDTNGVRTDLTEANVTPAEGGDLPEPVVVAPPAPTPEPEPEEEPQDTGSDTDGAPTPAPEPEPQDTGSDTDGAPTPAPEPEEEEPQDTGTDTPPTPTPPASDGSDQTPGDNSGADDSIELVAGEQVSEVAGGRVTAFYGENHGDIESIRILDRPDVGNLSVNPDNTLALVLTGTDHSGPLSFSYEATYQNGTTQTIQKTVNVAKPTQDEGWGEGNHYMLETDEEGELVIEYGDNHRKVFVSNSDDALSKADIAAREGLQESDITKNWLVDNPHYGGSEDLALDPEAGMEVWYGITGSTPSSNWLLFEKGYEYNDLGRLVSRESTGEDELHPVHITSYGEGEKPTINSDIFIFQGGIENLVISDINPAGGARVYDADNVIFDGLETHDGGLNVQGGSRFTLRDSEFSDISSDAPTDGSETWFPHTYRTTALYADDIDGLLIENTLFSQIGWEDGYDPDGSVAAGQPPSQFSHNVYLQYNTTDVTFRDNISTKAASFGAQIRGGGFIEDNVFLENNAGVNFLGGNYLDYEDVGNFSLFSGNLVTSAAYKTAYQIGALTLGVSNGGTDSTLIDNIVTHLADPNDAEELASKYYQSGNALDNLNDAFYDDTIIYNWISARQYTYDLNAVNTNVDSLDENALNQITAQIFAQNLLNDPNATIDDLVEFLEDQPDGLLGESVDADAILSFFKDGFELTEGDRSEATTLRFIPNVLGDGIRWDNRLNWDTGDLAGSVDGDSVDLGGNWVNYSGTNTLNNLDLGDEGYLDIGQGRLNIEGDISGIGQINVRDAGQLWTDGYSSDDPVALTVEGGRFANTGHVEGNLSLSIEDSQVLLGTQGGDFDLTSGDSIHIVGSTAKVGFDDEDGDVSVLRLQEDSILRLTSDEGGFASIQEFRSGAYQDAETDVESGINLGLSSLQLDVSGLNGEATDVTLLEADEIVGEFDDITLAGLASNQDAEITIDYENDSVQLTLSVAGAGTGQLNLTTIGEQTDVDSTELWDALTQGQGSYSDTDPTDLVKVDELAEEDLAA